MIIGFSTGCLYKTHDALAPSTIDIFRNTGCNAIEVMFHNVSDTERFSKLTKNDLDGFQYITVHAPIFIKGEEDKYKEALNAISKTHSFIGLNAVVLHPDMFDSFDILKGFKLPFSIENMDNRKKSCKDVRDLQRVFEELDMPMVLDVNHCYSNDSTMKLAKDLIEAFNDRIEEIHLSGFDTFHDPLYRTKQELIIDAIPNTDLPIIIESILGPEEIKVELEYIKNNL